MSIGADEIAARGGPQWGSRLEPGEVMRHGQTYQVYLVSYDMRGIHSAWSELQRHCRFVEIGDSALLASAVGGAVVGGALGGPVGAAALGTYLAGAPDPLGGAYQRPPRRLGANSNGDVWDASALVTTWRRPGEEYTWGGLYEALQRQHNKDRDRGTLGAAAVGRQLQGAHAAAWRASQASDAVGNAAGGLVDAGTEAVDAAGKLAHGGANVLRGVGAAGGALAGVHPLVAAGLFLTAVLAFRELAK